MNNSTNSGSNSSDFQPPTGNPQSNVGGGLQPTSTTNGSNVFNQPNINAQAFPSTSSLQVQTTGVGASPTSDTKQSGFNGGVTLIIIVAAVLVVGMLLLAKTAKSPESAKEKTVEEPVVAIKSSRSKKKLRAKKKKHSKKKK